MFFLMSHIQSHELRKTRKSKTHLTPCITQSVVCLMCIPVAFHQVVSSFVTSNMDDFFFFFSVIIAVHVQCVTLTYWFNPNHDLFLNLNKLATIGA